MSLAEPMIATDSAAPSSGSPRVLFVTLLDDVGSDRIVAAMGRLGCECAVAGARPSFAARSRFAKRVFALPRFGGHWLRGLVLRARFAEIVGNWRPDLIVPLDECSSGLLREPRLRRDPASARLLEASLGDPALYETVCSRERLITLAATLGLRTPRQRVVASLAEARRAASDLGYPLVLKREETCGGFGVTIVPDDAMLVAAFGQARRKALAKHLIQKALGHAGAHCKGLVAQAYVPGRMAFRVVACANGEILEGISFLAESIDPPVTGASTVLRPIVDDGMEAASRTVVAALGCSGFVSLDFILSSDGACLIEMNARPPASGHLGRLYGHDIHEALLDHFAGARRERDASSLSGGPDRVALFPRELDRDPASPALARSSDTLHDLPWDDLGVVEAYGRWLERRHPREWDEIRRRLPLGDQVTTVELRALVASIERYPR